VQLGFHLVAAVGELVQKKQEIYSYIQKEKQYTKQYKSTEFTKQENRHEKKIKNIKA
jgi:hypothetical protein